MARNPFVGYPEVFRTTAQQESAVRRAMLSGQIRRILRGLYTTNLTDPLESVIGRNRWQVVGLLFPGALVSHRTAFEARPSAKGTIFLTGSYDRILNLPGLRVRQMAGPGPLANDMPFVSGLSISSQARRLLECLASSPRGDDSAFLPRQTIEESLERQLLQGEDSLNRIRDSAREVANEIGLQEAFQRLDSIVGALLGTRRTKLTSPTAIARAAGQPYDARRMELFELLFAEAQSWPAKDRRDDVKGGPPFQNIAFFDSYFSNYIEGTEFSVDEAIDIVFEGKIPQARPKDAHDILGVYQLVGNMAEMAAGLSHLDAADFIERIKRWQFTILSARPEMRPGQFKEVANRAGGTLFVEPQLVEGTLARGFEFVKAIQTPLARAAFLMFLISEVHPFDDGNGRVARAAANAELISGAQRRIIVPTVYRSEYVDSLRDLSRQNRPLTLLRMMDIVQDFSSSIDFSSLDTARNQLDRWNAFDADAEAHLMRPPD